MHGITSNTTKFETPSPAIIRNKILHNVQEIQDNSSASEIEKIP